jgi:hypothetical protein
MSSSLVDIGAGIGLFARIASLEIFKTTAAD